MVPDRFTRGGPGVPSRMASRVCHAGHVHRLGGVWTRRRFFQVAAGVTAGTALAGTWAGKAGAAGPGIGLAEPIPATWEFFPGVFGHVQAPPFGVGSDPTTVNNFNGAAGIAFISGDVVRRNKRTGEVRTLPYSFNDMRFMKGVFRGRDGHERNATFAFI
jgi:hypothetical protein